MAGYNLNKKNMFVFRATSLVTMIFCNEIMEMKK